MEDRLLELQQMSGVSKNIVLNIKDTEDFLPKFNATSKLLQQAINQIKYNNQEILKEKESHRYATSGEVERGISEKINKLIEQNKVLSSTVKDQLHKMESDIEDTKVQIKKRQTKITERLGVSLPYSDSDEPELRMKIIIFESLCSKFSEVLKESQSVQLEYKATVKDKLARQAWIFNSNLSQAEIEELINDPEGMERMIQGIMVGPRFNPRIENEVSNLYDKYRDILKLERNVTIMHEMFLDMAMLVHANGKTLDTIQGHVNTASHFVKLAVDELKDGKDKHRTAKKWKILGYAFILVILIILLWPVLHVI